MILMIDNYDSFTFNIVQYLTELGQKVEVLRNDQITIPEIERLNPSGIVISPGPCTPDKAGISLSIIPFFEKKIPILGVCLGHQCIGQAYGGKIVKAKKVMHGKISAIYHSGNGLFSEMVSPFMATRYHSLVVERDCLPSCLEVNAWTVQADGETEEIMGFQHKENKVFGVQFHPESIMTEHGHLLLKNFLQELER